MPATTRSKSQPKQTHLEDFEDKPVKEKANTSKPRQSAPPKTGKGTRRSSKRELPVEEEQPARVSRPAKKQKQSSAKLDQEQPPAEDGKPVIINRAPVLQLWAACVSQS